MRKQTENSMKQTAPTTRIEYPLYNVCYRQTDGQVKTVNEKVSLKHGIEAMKKFDRMYCCNKKLLEGIEYLFLLPIREVRITEKQNASL